MRNYINLPCTPYTQGNLHSTYEVTLNIKAMFPIGGEHGNTEIKKINKSVTVRNTHLFTIPHPSISILVDKMELKYNIQQKGKKRIHF